MRARHLFAEAFARDARVLNDPSAVKNALALAAKEAGFRLLKTASHKFPKQGVTAFALLAESHLSIHTWPEKRFAALDIFTCGNADPRKALNSLRKSLGLTRVRCRTARREMP